MKDNKLINYINNNFNIDLTSYLLINELIKIYYDNIDELIKVLNNCNIDIKKEELQKEDII